MSYCTAADVVPFLPSGGLPNAARVVIGHNTGDYLESEGHGLVDDTEVRFRAEVGGSLPTGIAASTTYYAIVVSPARFQVAATEGGSAIDITTDGEDFVFTSPLPFASWIEWAERQVDSFLPAHVVPVVAPIPAMVVTACAELAAALGLAKTGGATIPLGETIDTIGVRLTRWAKSLPLRGTAVSTQSPVNLAITSSSTRTDSRGWVRRDSDDAEVLP